MKINSNQLIPSLKTNFYGAYVLSSNDVFWYHDTAEKIIQASVANGFDPKFQHTFTADNLNLEELEDTCSSPGLFADKVIVIITLPTLKGKNNEALKIIERCLNPALLAIINVPRLTQSELNAAKTLSSIANKGAITTFYDLSPSQLSNFIIERSGEYNLKFDREGLYYLQEAFEGNLVSLVQTFKKFNLSGITGFIDNKMLRDFISPSNHYSIFDLVEAFVDVNVKPERRMNMIKTLKDEGATLIEIISRIGNALTTLYEMRTIIDRGLSLEEYFANHRLLRTFTAKRPIYTKGAQSISAPDIMNLMELLSKADVETRTFKDDSAMIYLREIAVARSFPQQCKMSQDA